MKIIFSDFSISHKPEDPDRRDEHGWGLTVGSTYYELVKWIDECDAPTLAMYRYRTENPVWIFTLRWNPGKDN